MRERGFVQIQETCTSAALQGLRNEKVVEVFFMCIIL